MKTPMDGNPKDRIGRMKPGISCTPATSLVALGAVMKGGADKYGRYNWRMTGVDLEVYINAAFRHLMAIMDGEWLDAESGLPHAAHLMANGAVMVDAAQHGMLNAPDGHEALDTSLAESFSDRLKDAQNGVWAELRNPRPETPRREDSSDVG